MLPKSTPAINFFLDTIPKKNTIKAAEVKLVAFLNEKNLPSVLMDHLPKLIVSACPDSNIAKDLKISRTKASTLTITQLMQEALTDLKSCLNLNKSYSLIIDETTDLSTTKSLAVLIRFCDNVSVKDRFLGLIQVHNATADGLFQVYQSFKEILHSSGKYDWLCSR